MPCYRVWLFLFFIALGLKKFWKLRKPLHTDT